MSRLLTVEDLRALGFGRDRAYQLMHSKVFPSMKVGGRYYVTEEALTKWLKEHQNKEFRL